MYEISNDDYEYRLNKCFHMFQVEKVVADSVRNLSLGEGKTWN